MAAFNDIQEKRRASGHTPMSVKKAKSSNEIGSTGVGIWWEKCRSSKNPSLRRNPEERAENSDLLKGMVLFFIPNSKKNGARKIQMILFVQHGADMGDI